MCGLIVRQQLEDYEVYMKKTVRVAAEVHVLSIFKASASASASNLLISSLSIL